MKYSEKLMKVALLIPMILVLGWTNISTATAQTRNDPVEVERTTAEACKAKIEAFDDLLLEAVNLKSQREQCWGSAQELRRIMNSMNDDLIAAQQARNSLQIRLDQEVASKPRRAVWFAVGAGTGVVVTAVTAVTVFLISNADF